MLTKKNIKLGLIALCIIAYAGVVVYTRVRNPGIEGKTSTRSNPAEEAQKKVIVTQANLMAQAIITKDFDTFVTYTYPKVVEMIGGKEKMIALFNENVAQLLKVEIGTPGPVVTEGTELQAVVPQIITAKVEGGKVVLNSSLIAISSDKGAHWTFIDTSDKDVKTLQAGGLTNLSSQLVIPPFGKPTFIKD